MKENNKKNLVFIGVIVILVLVVIILGILLLSEKNKNTNPSDTKVTERNEQTDAAEQITTESSEDTSSETEEVAETQTTQDAATLAAEDEKTADTIETLIAKELTAYASGDVPAAIADTDREMYSYATVNDILRNANIEHGKTTFEQNVRDMLASYTTESDGTMLIWPKQSGQVFWVKITGTFEEGYQVKVQTAASDPYAAERVTYNDVEISFYYERKDMMYDSETCSLAFWNESDKSIKYYFFDDYGRIDVTVPEGVDTVGFFIKDVQGSRTASADGASGIIKFVDDTAISLSGQIGNVMNVHIEEGVYAEDGITVTQEWFLNR